MILSFLTLQSFVCFLSSTGILLKTYNSPDEWTSGGHTYWPVTQVGELENVVVAVASAAAADRPQGGGGWGGVVSWSVAGLWAENHTDCFSCLWPSTGDGGWRCRITAWGGLVHNNYACKLIRSATCGCDSKCRRLVVSVLRTHVECGRRRRSSAAICRVIWIDDAWIRWHWRAANRQERQYSGFYWDTED